MIAAGKIAKALALSIFPASFLGSVFSAPRSARPLFQRFIFESRISDRHRISFLVFLCFSVLVAGGLGPDLKIFRRFFAQETRTQAEIMLLSMSLKDRIAYIDGIESLVTESPEVLTKLIGLDIMLLIGSADFSRREGERVVWQYATPACILDVYIDTQHAQNGDPKAGSVVYYETRTRKPAQPPDPACLSRLIDAARAGRLERLLLPSGDSTDA